MWQHTIVDGYEIISIKKLQTSKLICALWNPVEWNFPNIWAFWLVCKYAEITKWPHNLFYKIWRNPKLWISEFQKYLSRKCHLGEIVHNEDLGKASSFTHVHETSFDPTFRFLIFTPNPFLAVFGICFLIVSWGLNPGENLSISLNFRNQTKNYFGYLPCSVFWFDIYMWCF